MLTIFANYFFVVSPVNPKVHLLIQLLEVLRCIINDSMTIETTTSKGKVVGLQQPEFRSIGGLTNSARW